MHREYGNFDLAQFKLIKRSNTYNALAQALKVKCTHCQEDCSVADLATHILKYCQSVQEFCRFCSNTFERRAIEQHETQECEERLYECPHCCLMFRQLDHALHEDSCEEKLLQCCHAGCGEKIERKFVRTHEDNCRMKILLCRWCQAGITRAQEEEHEHFCEKRQVACQWCLQGFGVTELLAHECAQRRETCRLCEGEVLAREMNSHKMDCMFDSLVAMKEKNDIVNLENERLREKIGILQGIIEETVSSRESNTMKVLKEMREQDRKLVERDLLRIDNSIKSIEKLKKEELASHMKFPHLIQSWCPICRELEKKFRTMKEPLLASRKHTLQKLAEMDKFGQTPH